MVQNSSGLKDEDLKFVPYDKKLSHMVQIISLSDSRKKKSVPYK
ncbi:hypothetical protein [uncultured Eubacterium sp.]|nr:hypothetical protein [uncultured Eubacterium sp.]